ncbi:MAG: hypothetical protein ACREMM_01245 [Gemmatimonadales bacterium]
MRRTTLRRVIGTALLVATPISAAESVMGVLRDGAVHYESGVVAALHADLGAAGRHGHEDHQHGTPVDHCTHVHGIATVVHSFHLSIATPVSSQQQTDPVLSAGEAIHTQFHPPRA